MVHLFFCACSENMRSRCALDLKKRSMSAWKTTFYLFAVPPVAFIVSLISFYIQATKILGHSPTYGRPDPKELYIYMDYAPVVNLAA